MSANEADTSYQPFAWDGISFHVPSSWHLSVYKFIKKLTRVEFEDDYTIRLEAEWLRPKGRLDSERVQRRYNLQSRKLTEGAEDVTPLEGLPTGWVATQYSLAEQHQLVTAIFMEPDSKLFAFLLIYFEPEDPETPEQVIREICRSFKLQVDDTRPWQLYDIDLILPSDFELNETNFQTGMKKLTFTWNRRRLLFGFVNLADMVLKKHSQNEWLVRYLNSSRFARSGYFYLNHDAVEFRRRKRHKLGHIEELFRRCTQYTWGCIHQKESNLLVPWVFNYREPADLTRLDVIRISKQPLGSANPGRS